MTNFAFIKDKSFKVKLNETFNYIKFLLTLQKKSLGKDILISLNRDIIIHTTSILEGLLTYLIIKIEKNGSEIEKKVINDFVIKKEYKKINGFSELNLYRGEDKLYLSVLKESKGAINGKLNLGILIKLVKKLKIFDSNLVDCLEDILKIRNDLHIQKILDKDVYEKELTDTKMLELFQFTKDIQSKIIDKLDLLEKFEIKEKEKDFDLNSFISKLKENGAKGGLTMALRGSNLSLSDSELIIGIKSSIAKSQIENANNVLLIEKSLSDIGIQIPKVRIEIIKNIKYVLEKVETEKKEKDFDLNSFISKLKENGAKGGLTMALRGSTLKMEGETLIIWTYTKIAKEQIEKTINRSIMKNVLKEMGFNNPQIDFYLK